MAFLKHNLNRREVIEFDLSLHRRCFAYPTLPPSIVKSILLDAIICVVFS
mgnify:CR=1 FL=1